MRHGLGQADVAAQSQVTQVSQNGGPLVPGVTGKEIPYDYVARFQLLGQRGNRVQDVINVSVEGAFVATAIAYSFYPAETPKFAEVLNRYIEWDGARRNREGSETADTLIAKSLPFWFVSEYITGNPLASLYHVLVRYLGIQFKYSLVDSSSGRELQNMAIQSMAGLGNADGNGPFRPLARPVLFMPRSTIRIEVVEVSEGRIYRDGELQIVLHGYKILGYGT